MLIYSPVLFLFVLRWQEIRNENNAIFNKENQSRRKMIVTRNAAQRAWKTAWKLDDKKEENFKTTNRDKLEFIFFLQRHTKRKQTKMKIRKILIAKWVGKCA